MDEQEFNEPAPVMPIVPSVIGEEFKREMFAFRVAHEAWQARGLTSMIEQGAANGCPPEILASLTATRDDCLAESAKAAEWLATHPEGL